MSNEANDGDDLTAPEIAAGPESVAADGGLGQTLDPNDEVPVPLAMWPSELDERAQVVEALRGNGPPPRTDTQVDPA